jgi:hypothetical protein
VFLERPGDEPPPPVFSLRFEGTIVARIPRDDLGFRRLRLRDDVGKIWVMAYDLPTAVGLDLPVRDGQRYDFTVDYAAGSPAAGGLIVREGGALVFAAASDQRLGEHVLRDGIEPFHVEQLPPSRDGCSDDRCIEAIRNCAMRFTIGGVSVELFQGASGALGEYRAVVLAAREVTYRAECADAGVVGLSYAVTRTRAP